MNGGRARGTVLFVCLVFLLVLTVLAASAVRTSVLETRLARNQQEVQGAFQAAEVALRHGERLLATLDAVDDGAAWWRVGPDQPEPWRDPAVWQGSGSRVVSGTGPGTARYLIEHLTSIGDEAATFEVFRITARGVGSEGDVAVLLQSTYGHLLPAARSDESDEGVEGGDGLRGGRWSWRELDG